MMILGLDLSLTSTGYALFKERALFASGEIKTKPDLFWFDRLYSIYSGLTWFFSTADVVVFEAQIAVYRSARTTSELAKVHGVLGILLATHDIEFISIAPAQLRSWAGVPKKQKIWDMTHASFPYGKDEIDAICLGIMGGQCLGVFPLMSEAQRKIISRLTVERGGSHGK